MGRGWSDPVPGDPVLFREFLDRPWGRRRRQPCCCTASSNSDGDPRIACRRHRHGHPARGWRVCRALHTWRHDLRTVAHAAAAEAPADGGTDDRFGCRLAAGGGGVVRAAAGGTSGVPAVCRRIRRGAVDWACQPCPWRTWRLRGTDDPVSPRFGHADRKHRAGTRRVPARLLPGAARGRAAAAARGRNLATATTVVALPPNL